MAANCIQARTESGFGCYDKGITFQICDNKDADNFRSFVGCCKGTIDFNNKESIYGCKQGDITDATYSKDDLQPLECVNTSAAIAYKMLSCKSATDKEGKPHYIGCCAASCSAKVPFRCPQAQTGWAGFTGRDALNIFMQKIWRSFFVHRYHRVRSTNLVHVKDHYCNTRRIPK